MGAGKKQLGANAIDRWSDELFLRPVEIARRYLPSVRSPLGELVRYDLKSTFPLPTLTLAQDFL
jgi:hypothetical protein